jgi:hypothetical protein
MAAQQHFCSACEDFPANRIDASEVLSGSLLKIGGLLIIFISKHERAQRPFCHRTHQTILPAVFVQSLDMARPLLECSEATPPNPRGP